LQRTSRFNRRGIRNASSRSKTSRSRSRQIEEVEAKEEVEVEEGVEKTADVQEYSFRP